VLQSILERNFLGMSVMNPDVYLDVR